MSAHTFFQVFIEKFTKQEFVALKVSGKKKSSLKLEDRVRCFHLVSVFLISW